MTSLPVAPDVEKRVIDFLKGLPSLSGWEVGTKTVPNTVPHQFIQVRAVDGGEVAHDLFYRFLVQTRVWHESEFIARRFSTLVSSEIRRGLSGRLVSPPVPLPDLVDPSRNFIQSLIQLPMIGEQP